MPRDQWTIKLDVARNGRPCVNARVTFDNLDPALTFFTVDLPAMLIEKESEGEKQWRRELEAMTRAPDGELVAIDTGIDQVDVPVTTLKESPHADAHDAGALSEFRDERGPVEPTAIREGGRP